MKSRIASSAAARHFSDILNRVAYRGEEFVVERGGRAVCRIVPAAPVECHIEDLLAILEAAPQADSGYARGVRQAIRKQPLVPADPWSR